MTPVSDSPTSSTRDVDRAIYVGLLGFAAAAVIQLIDKQDFNSAQLVAVYAFAAAIPLLTTGLVTDFARRSGHPVPAWRDGLGFLGVLSAVVGIAAVFFHFGTGPGIVFAAGTFLGVLLIRAL